MKLENESALRARLLDPPKARRLSSQRRLLYARWDLLLFFCERETFYLTTREKKNACGILCTKLHSWDDLFSQKKTPLWLLFFFYYEFKLFRYPKNTALIDRKVRKISK